MARQPKDSIKLFANLEGATPDDDRPDLVVSALDARRKTIFQGRFGKDGVANIPQDVVKKAERFTVGPPTEDDDEPEPSQGALKFRRTQFEAVLERGQIDIARTIWAGWLRFLRCVSGRVRVCRRSRWWFDDLVARAVEPLVAEQITLSPSIAAGTHIPETVANADRSAPR